MSASKTCLALSIGMAHEPNGNKVHKLRFHYDGLTSVIYICTTQRTLNGPGREPTVRSHGSIAALRMRLFQQDCSHGRLVAHSKIPAQKPTCKNGR